MRAGFLQCLRHRLWRAVEQQRANSVDGIETHSSRSAGGENAVSEFFPKPGVRSFTPNFLKLTEPFSNLFASRPVSGNHSFDCDGFLIALHCSLSMGRFYERAGNIVNDMLCRKPHRNLPTHDADRCYDGDAHPRNFPAHQSLLSLQTPDDDLEFTEHRNTELAAEY